MPTAREKRTMSPNRFPILAAITAAAVVAVGFGGAPANATPGATYGDPATAAKYWRYQQYWDDCALMSSADVVGEVTGAEPSEEDIIDMAQSTPSTQGPGPVYVRPADPKSRDAGQGTWFRDIPALLARYNVGATIVDGDVDGLERQLAAGHKVIASVNAEIIWREPVEDRDRRGNPTHNHTVVVTGVDADRQVVHLNDSGSRQGRDEQVPLALFVQAWDTSNELMAVTD